MKFIIGIIVVFLFPWFIANVQEPNNNDKWAKVYLKWLVIFTALILIFIFF